MLRPSNSIRWILPVLVVLSLAGCSRDPNVRKAKFLSSGMDYARTGKYAEAVVQFHNAIDIDPKLAPAHFELARAYLHLNAGTEAIREFQQGLVLDPANSQAKLELAPLLVALKQYDQAEALVHEVLTADPKNARAHAILGQRYLEAQDFPRAIHETQTAIELEPRIEYYAALGALHLATGKPSDAENDYKSAVALAPKSVQAHVYLGEFYFSQRRMDQAATEMRTGAALDPHAVSPRVFLGRIYAATGKLDDAEKTLRNSRGLLRTTRKHTGRSGISTFRAVSRKRPSKSSVPCLRRNPRTAP